MKLFSLSLFFWAALSFSAPRSNAQTATPTQGVERSDGSESTLEFRGIINDAKGPRFFLYDSKTSLSRWVFLQETYRGWRVMAYRAEGETIILQNGAHSVALALGQSRAGTVSFGTVSLTSTVAEPPASPAPTSSAGSAPATLDFSASTVNLSALPMAEQQRLNELAAEVRRRQAVRSATGGSTP